MPTSPPFLECHNSKRKRLSLGHRRNVVSFPQAAVVAMFLEISSGFLGVL